MILSWQREHKSKVSIAGLIVNGSSVHVIPQKKTRFVLDQNIVPQKCPFFLSDVTASLLEMLKNREHNNQSMKDEIKARHTVSPVAFRNRLHTVVEVSNSKNLMGI